MPKVEKSGTYKDSAGNYWWYREGDQMPDGLVPAEIPSEMKRAGAPENRADAAAAPEKRGGKGAR